MNVLPEYPSTLHLPWNPNSKGDKIATEQEASVIFDSPRVFVQEKIDGANCGMAFIDGHPVLRNRTKILRKGQELKNPSKAQFASAWNWMHDHKQLFDEMAEMGPYCVYGEWMVQQHGMYYDVLPDWFVAYDVYDYEKKQFIDPFWSDTLLKVCGFDLIPFDYFHLQKSELTVEKLVEFANKPSNFSLTEKREGIVVKVGDDQFVTHKFKMVREGFDQGCLLGEVINKNTVNLKYRTNPLRSPIRKRSC